MVDTNLIENIRKLDCQRVELVRLALDHEGAISQRDSTHNWFLLGCGIKQ